MSAVLLTKLIEALQCLPGVGPKSAQRMTYHLLERDRDAALHLAEMLQAAVKHIGHCKSCRNFSETERCSICSDVKRDCSVICIVESPADVAAIEHATDYRGLYFVLMGHLSPLDGIGPAEIGLQELETQLTAAGVEEIILATNTTVEGEATAHYIADMVRGRDIKVSRIAHGVPMGGELEFVNSSTLHHAFLGRRSL